MRELPLPWLHRQFFFFKWGGCKYWMLCLLGGKPSRRLKAEGGGARELNIQNVWKNWWKAFALSFLPLGFFLFPSFPVRYCGQVQPTYFIDSLELEWAVVTLKVIWSKLPSIVIIPRFIQKLSFFSSSFLSNIGAFQLKVHWWEERSGVRQFWVQIVAITDTSESCLIS